MRQSEQAIQVLGFAVEVAVPFLFVLGVRSVFQWGRVAWMFWSAVLVGSLAVVVLLTSSVLPQETLIPMLSPGIQLLWYHLLRRVSYGSWRAEPEFVVFDFRPGSGSQRDRIFGVVFVLSSLAIPVFVL